MDLDGLSTRRAVLGGAAVTLSGAGVVYGASRLGATDSGTADGARHPSGDGLYASRRSIDLGENGGDGPTIDLAGNPIMGSSEADVTIFYWTDYQCPFCQKFERETLPKLVDEHVTTGTARLAFFQFPYIGEASHTAARMDKCVWRQVAETAPDRYLAWHGTVFDEQGKERSGWAKRENLLAVTREVDGVDADAVATCLDEHADAVEESVADDRSLGERLGIRGTPGFVLRNRETGAMGRLIGAQPYERFADAIEKIRSA